MYNNYLRPNNNYMQRLTALEQQAAYQQPMYPQTIQPINQIQQQAMCYFVASPEELASLNPMPNMVYLGINSNTKEIYTRKMNNNGIIEVETYIKASESQEKDGYKIIMEELAEIKKQLSIKEKKDERITQSINKPSDAGNAPKKSNDEPF